MKLGLILDIQHAGRASKPSDLGAAADLDGDGKIERDEHEARLTPVYAQAAQDLAAADGVRVLRIDGGEYPTRHRVAVELAASDPGRRWLYVACHLNAGGGDYGLVIHDSRSQAGRLAAEAVRAEVAKLPGLRRALAGATSAEGSDWPRAWSTIRGIYDGPANLSAICFEPCFMDQPAHRPLLTKAGLDQIGAALFRGAVLWAAS